MRSPKECMWCGAALETASEESGWGLTVVVVVDEPKQQQQQPSKRDEQSQAKR